jgi:hypothetical protein
MKQNKTLGDFCISYSFLKNDLYIFYCSGMRMAAVTHIYFLSKFIEFFDTFLFIVRKKFRNVSKLQLIHHGLMPIYTFLMVRWVPNGKKLIYAMLYFSNILYTIYRWE